MTKTTENTEYLRYVFVSLDGSDIVIDVPLGTSLATAYQLLSDREKDSAYFLKKVVKMSRFNTTEKS